MSPDGVPVCPFASSNNLSETTVFVVDTVVVDPLTVRLPVIVRLPPMAYISDSISVTNLDNAAFLFVPPAPSSTTIKSDVVKAAPMSVPPSISKADSDTLPAVDIVSSLLSAIAALEFMSALSITPDPMAAVPPDIVISPLIVP